jgi:allantoin racemase
MRICFVGPSSRLTTLRDFVSPGVTLEARHPASGPASVESKYEEYLSVPGLMSLAVQAEQDGFDAIVPECFNDSGIDGMRELVHIPVVGPGTTSMLVAANLGHRFGIIDVLETLVRPIENLAKLSGVGEKLARIRQIGIPVLDLERDHDETFTRLTAVSRLAIEQDRADVLILGCAGLASHALALQKLVSVPVINPLAVALRTAEMLIACGLSHSKRSFPQPPKFVGDGDRARR